MSASNDTAKHQASPIAAFFTKDPADAERFTPTSHTRGPWSAEHCHAGPPSGLLARAMEMALPTQRLTRLTVELTRPIPFNTLKVSATVLREGRTVSTAEARIETHDGKPVLSARGLFMKPVTESLTLPKNALNLQTTGNYGSANDAQVGAFPVKRTLHSLPAFIGDGIETRYPPGETSEPGKTCAWLKTVPLFEDESPSPFQRICPLADCGNAFARLAEVDEITFMNTDLTLLLHRDPIGEWMGTDSECFWEPNGIGLSDSRLFDEHGIVGRAIQTLLLR